MFFFSIWAEQSPLRRCVPSGRLAGPTEKPFLSHFARISDSPCSTSAETILGAISDDEEGCSLKVSAEHPWGEN